jgi:ribosome recycling factor
MTQDKVLQDMHEKMQKVVHFTTAELATIHAGKASVAMVEGIAVEVYESHSRLRDIAAITTPDATTILIQPWDKGAAKAIEKALLAANLGFTPLVDSGRIRCNIPKMSRERRQEMAKRAATSAEAAKVSVRALRREAVDVFKEREKAGEISEDDLKLREKDVQKVTDEVIGEIDGLYVKKEKELMTI